MPDDTIGRDDGRPPSPDIDLIVPDSGGGDAANEKSGDATAVTVVAREEGAPGFGVIKLRVVSSDGAPVGDDISVGRAGFNNHSPSISGLVPPAQNDGQARGINVAWIESATGDTSGVGRIMWQRLAANLDAANDNSTWVADHDAAGTFGSEPSIAALDGGETLLTWIGTDGNAHGRLYPPHDFTPDDDGNIRAYAAVNAALADLGPVAAAADGSRRLQAVEARAGNLAVMWLALADHGLVLRGKMFATPLNPQSDDDGDGRWTESPIADIRPPPGFAGQFSLQGAGDGSADVVVSYVNPGPDTSTALAHRIGGPGADAGLSGPKFLLGSVPAAEETGHSTVYVAPDREAAADTIAPYAESPHAVHTGGQAPPLSLVLNIPGASAMGTEPVVTATKDGFAVTWETAGAAAGTVAINMAIFDALGTVRTVIAVTDNALATVPPSITDAGDGAAVAYVDANEGSLVVKAYDGAGAQVGQEVVVDTGAGGDISEVTMDSRHDDNSGHHDELAVVYVRDDHDDQSDYGNVVLQRYSLPGDDEDSGGLVALGGDGRHDGADAPVTLTDERDGDPTTTEDVIGRAPTVTELDDGEIAVVWIEKDGAGETIKGRVLESDGSQVLRIDLTDLLQDGGIAKGTKPILLANSDGDILVSWLQADGDGDGYVVMASLYQAAGVGQWIAPEQPIRLQDFDRAPKDFSVAWSDADGTAIDVTWRADSSGKGSGDGTLSQRFDLDGNDVGRLNKLDDSHGGHLDSDTALSTAGLVDGQIVVVYAEQSRNGNLDLATQVIDTQPSVPASVDVLNQSVPDTAVAHAADHSDSDITFTTGVDQEIAINVKAAAGDATISYVNGVPITTAMPVDVGSGWIQLREDGWLTVSPDEGYAGKIAFDYTVGGGDTHGPEAVNRITVNVAPDATTTASGPGNATATLPEKSISGADDIRLADIASDDGSGTKGLSLAGLDADLFKIVGTTLYLKAGIDFDFDTKPTLNVAVHSGEPGPADHDQAVNFKLDVDDANSGKALHDHLMADTFVFAPGFGEGHGPSDGAHEVIDVSSSGYASFQELIDSGALVQAGSDVVLTFDPADPYHSDKITLRGIDLSVLSSADFKF